MKEQLRIEIGERIKMVRKAFGLTQEQFVENFEIGRANYARIESGEIFPGISIMNVLRSKFNISMDWLISNKGEMFLQEKKEEDIVLDYGEDTEEIAEMLHIIQRIPRMKEEILSFFYDFRRKNKSILDRMLENEEELKRLDPS